MFILGTEDFNFQGDGSGVFRSMKLFVQATGRNVCGISKLICMPRYGVYEWM